MRDFDVLITEAELLASSPERVHHWLESRSMKSGNTKISSDEEMEHALLARNEPLINLGLARFSKYSEIVKILFARRDSGDSINGHLDAVRLAVLSNESVYETSFISAVPDAMFFDGAEGALKWLATANESEVYALFRNSKLDDLFLRNFFEGKDAWLALDEPRRMTAILAISKNKRMHTTYAGDLDGFAQYTYNSVFTAAGSLATTLPTTANWAIILGQLLEAMPPAAHGIKDPILVAQRWQTPSGNDKAHEEVDIAKNGYLGTYQLIRKTLAQLIVVRDGSQLEGFLTSEDPAFRAAAYSSMRLTPDQILAAYALDKNLAVNSCQHNGHVWKDPACRQVLHEISWDVCEYNNNFMDSANAYNYFKDEKRSKNPEWFKDEEDHSELTSHHSSKTDVEQIIEPAIANDYLLQENMIMFSQLNQSIKAINDRVGWIWWFSLGVLVASIW